MDVPLVSILLPVFNAAPHLKQALDSILSQTIREWEVIAVDDGSEDGSAEILTTCASIDSRIRPILTRHEGIVSALQTACAAARAPFLARMDSDDVSFPERLELQLRQFDRYPGLEVCGARVRISGPTMGSGSKRYESWINSLIGHDAITREVFVECPIPHPTLMMRRQFLEQLGGYRAGPWPEDYDLVLRAWQAGARFAKPSPILLLWRDHDLRLSRRDSRYSPEAFRGLKRRYLRDCALDLPGRPFIQWGAGEVGKQWLREWEQPPLAVVDINPRKIGRRIHGVEVIAQEDLPRPGHCFILVAVGTPGARDEIRGKLAPGGYVEQRDYLFIA